VRSDVLRQIANGQLAQPSWLQPGTAKVAVIGTIHPLYQCTTNKKMELMNHGLLETLRTVQQIMSNPIQGLNYFDFIVCYMPATALHPQILPSFMQTIHSLLGRRYSVHIHKAQLPNYGLLLDKSFIVILASPICAQPPWDWNHSNPFPKSFADVIGDLSFQNPRKEHTSGPYALRCKKTSSNTDETVYNHNTGLPQIPGATQPVTLNTSMALRLPLFGGPFCLHPGKFPNPEPTTYI
jgi:hypothetical protein